MKTLLFTGQAGLRATMSAMIDPHATNDPFASMLGNEGPSGDPSLSVGLLVQHLREVVRSLYLPFWIRGQVSNLALQRSGHIYFTLKDDVGQIKCALFRNYANRLTNTFADGDEIFVKAQPDMYAVRGEIQLVVTDVTAAGQGDLQRRFEELKARLLTEGLFASDRKKPLPRFPLTIGVVTSPTGAAVRDICQICHRRWPMARILISPVRVQGETAAAEIAAAIVDQNRAAMADVLVVGRGGGSLEDLWAFNQEEVVRAIAASRLPVVSAVGHETDTTLADLASDVRAPTPSAAAEIVTPDYRELLTHMYRQQRHAAGIAAGCVQNYELRLARAQQNLTHPGIRTLEYMQHLDDLSRRCDTALTDRWNRMVNRLLRAAEQLHDRSPLTLLGRGYALAKAEDGTVISHSRHIPVGKTFLLRLTDTTIRARRIRATDHSAEDTRNKAAVPLQRPSVDDQGTLF